MLVPGVLFAASAAVCRPGRLSERFARSFSIAMGCFLALSPWMVRNWIVMGDPIATTTHGGYTLALANNPYYYRDVVFPGGDKIWQGMGQERWLRSVEEATRGLSEPASDRVLRDQAVVWSRANPRAFGRCMLARFLRFWSVAPSREVYGARARWLTAAWTIPFWAAAIAGIWSRRWLSCPGLLVVLIPASLAVVHLVYWTDMRMRAPAIPALAVLASSAAWGRRNDGPIRGSAEGRAGVK